MATVDGINSTLGKVRDTAFDAMLELLEKPDTAMSIGAKSAALLKAQAAMGITDGVQNVIAKGYNRWQQTGQ